MRRHGLIERAQKLDPLWVSMPFLTKAVDLAVGRIEGGKQSSGAVAFVVVGHGPAASELQRQSGLGTIQGLNRLFSSTHSTRAYSGAGSGTNPRSLPVFPQTPS
jgi:hypothetical protein